MNSPYPLKPSTIRREHLGRSCGGFSSKIHAVCDALGNPLGFIVSGGQVHDVTQAIALISGLEATPYWRTRAMIAMLFVSLPGIRGLNLISLFVKTV
ncbi:MAG: transposase [Vampirovibrio sp.]